ncbi:MAG: amino acid ABC transporter permease [Clostridiales bacterium]|nr:amino acid ABC transporter permease [Clostridiales bacterium]
MTWFEAFQDKFYVNFIQDDRFVSYMLAGLKVTLELTVIAAIIGICLGVLTALVRITHDKTITVVHAGPSRILLVFFNELCKLFITVIRGVPVVVQLLIWFFVIFPHVRNGVIVGIICFGINSAAYVSEIIRAGIMSVDGGQMEAGRSLGLNYIQTMYYIILPQAFKNALPTLCNEFIVLLKETAVVGYIAVMDLTKGAYIIVGRTYEALLPLIAAAVIYLVLVMLLSWLFGKLERRLRASDTR